ncbi:MAG TPA: metal ABC transporter ATP-binding protein [Gemmatimonadales bacterium]|nr:metal ABC transporter ATP-binding protein [Gemmatimonadales bacterium]
MASILEVDRLSVRFGQQQILLDLTFAVPEGATLAIIGPNGSGKTVLFRALIGALPYTGEVRWGPGARIGYVPQKLDLERDLPVTGLDFLRARARVGGMDDTQVEQALDLVSLAPGVVRQPIGTLSGGQFQRLLLGFALMGRPTVLLCDEPTAGVDEPGEERLYTMLHRLQVEERLTLLLISHELNVIYRYATAVLCLSLAQRPCLGPPVEVLTPERLQKMYGAPVQFHRHDGSVD